MKIGEQRVKSAARWFDQQASGLGRLYDREIRRRSSRCHGHVRRTPFKSLAWCEAISRAAACYRFAANTLREMPLDVPELIRGPAPYGRAIRATMDRRAAYIAKAWDELAHTKDADAALRAAYQALVEFMLVE